MARGACRRGADRWGALMVNFFIDRPIFSWVIAIVIMLAGGLSILSLPVAQYPEIAPPLISISVAYPGASAETVQSTVVQVIEQQLSGLDHLVFSSASTKDGSMDISLTFEQGTDADTAQVQVQNKLSLAEPLLPLEVQRQGIRVTKGTRNFLLVASLVSTDGSMDGNAIGDFLVSNVQDPLSRTLGVGDVQVFGSQFAMRVWLDPARLHSYALTAVDVNDAIGSQNVQVSSGEIGGLPTVPGHQLNATVIGPSRLQTVDEFKNILLRVNQDGSQVRLRDVARIELDSESHSLTTRYNGKSSSSIAIRLASGANALDTADAVRATIERLRPEFPPGLDVVYPYDTTPFVRLSIEEVVVTLFEAIVLVFVIMYLFLQNLRATLIPTIAVPVVLLGTFGVLAASGFTINTLTMFGMVLAIGLLVDDAIVVVENVERVMAEDGLAPKEATRKSMNQVTGALVGIAMVLSAVFLPMAFFGGSTGVIYRQFSITIASAMALSVIVALVFTPALCATLLKPVAKGRHEPRRGFFGWFNRVFDAGTRGYAAGVRRMLGANGRSMLAYGAIVAALALMFSRIPTGFLPDEDQGVMFLEVKTPPGATLARMEQALAAVRDYVLTEEKDGISSILEVYGFSFSGRGQNAGIAFFTLKDWDERPAERNHVQAIAGRIVARFAAYKDAAIFAFPPPPIRAGQRHRLRPRAAGPGRCGSRPPDASAQPAAGSRREEPGADGGASQRLGRRAAVQDRHRLGEGQRVRTSHQRHQHHAIHGLGFSYVNQFIDGGRVKRVLVQGDAPSRMRPEDFGRWYVRNNKGDTAPFSAFASGHWTQGPPKLERYNGIASMEILGQPGPGYSTGEAMQEIERLIAQLPAGVGHEWTGLSYEERLSGGQAPALYALSLVVVFLCLAALYESWSIPVSVMLVVPLGVIGAVLGALLRGFDNNVYFQVALVTTVGLSAKNAILIVEFAKANVEQGMGLIEAAVHAAGQRLRPILMTSLAFMFGVMPLAISSGAGSGAQNAVGTGVVGGTLSATALGIFFVPVFFVVVRSLVKPQRLGEVAGPSTAEAH